MVKKAKIICTIGPASNDEKIMIGLIENGMDIARLNFSHGTHQEHKKNIALIRKVSRDLSKPVAIMIDLQGPKIRIGTFKDGPVNIAPGDKFTITTKNIPGTQKTVSTTYSNLPNDVKPGDNILINDGLINLKVLSTTKSEVECEVIIGGILYDRKGINLPGVKISAPSLTDKDNKDLKFALDEGIDYVALSFVREAKSIRALKEFMDKKAVPVIAKLEKPEALNNLEEIIMEADGVMVARGDLGVEISAQKVPVVQKMIINKCQMAAKPVITATQMLDSMMSNAIPTRAEASDVANAVFDGTDVLMLSGETAFGKYPVESVKMMKSIIEEAEKADFFRFSNENLVKQRPLSSSKSICHAADMSASDINAKYIVVFTESGFTAKIMSKYRPKVPVIALTRHEKTLNRLAMYWGVIPSLIHKQFSIYDDLKELEIHLKQEKLIKSGDSIVIIAGSSQEEGGTNMMRLHRAI